MKNPRQVFELGSASPPKPPLGFDGVRVAHLFSFLCCVFSFVCLLRLVSCVLNVASFSELSIFE